jgi:hypothetical protein
MVESAGGVMIRFAWFTPSSLDFQDDIPQMAQLVRSDPSPMVTEMRGVPGWRRPGLDSRVKGSAGARTSRISEKLWVQKRIGRVWRAGADG